MSEVAKFTRVNAGKPKKAKKSGKKARKGGKRRARSTPKSGGKRRSRRAAPKTAGRRWRRKARRNPGIDIKGNGATFLGGALGELVARPIGKYIRSKTENPLLRGLADAGVPAVLGVVAQRWVPNIGKGMVAAGGANAAEHIMDKITRATGPSPGVPNATLQGLGYATLGAADVEKVDGQYILNGPNGVRSVMMPIDGRQVQLDRADGSTETRMLVAGDRFGNALVMHPVSGAVQMISGLEGMGDIVPENTVGADDDFAGDDDGIGDIVPENTVGDDDFAGDDDGIGGDDDGIGDDGIDL